MRRGSDMAMSEVHKAMMAAREALQAGTKEGDVVKFIKANYAHVNPRSIVKIEQGFEAGYFGKRDAVTWRTRKGN